MQHYLYKGVEYKSERELRKAIFEKERKAFAKCETEADWAKHNVEVKEVTSVVTEEQMARKVRFQRDRLLSACDYYVMPDYPSTEEGLTKVKAYRQALRDITQQDGFPYQIDWPVKPSVLG